MVGLSEKTVSHWRIYIHTQRPDWLLAIPCPLCGPDVIFWWRYSWTAPNDYEKKKQVKFFFDIKYYGNGINKRIESIWRLEDIYDFAVSLD